MTFNQMRLPQHFVLRNDSLLYEIVAPPSVACNYKIGASLLFGIWNLGF